MSPGSFAVALLLLATSTLARIDLVQPAGSRYGYGVSQPAKWTKALSARPLTLFLHGPSQRIAPDSHLRQRIVRLIRPGQHQPPFQWTRQSDPTLRAGQPRGGSRPRRRAIPGRATSGAAHHPARLGLPALLCVAGRSTALTEQGTRRLCSTSWSTSARVTPLITAASPSLAVR